MLRALPITADAFAPYGWMLGKAFPADPAIPAYTHPTTDFWHEHLFDPGHGGKAEVLWVNYRNTGPVTQLEVHLRTQQAIVPLTGPVIHIVARSTPAGMPDLGTLAAFSVQPGMGLCMAPGIWHATRVPDAPVTCLMLTRQSTTQDLVAHLRDGAPAHESALATIAPTNWEIAPDA